MVDAALNFKTYATERHRVFRMLRAPAELIKTYRHMIDTVGMYRSALIFPEQFLIAENTSLYKISHSNENQVVSISGHSISPKLLFDVEGTRIKTVEQTIDTEQKFASAIKTPLFHLSNDRGYRSDRTDLPRLGGESTDLYGRTSNTINYFFTNKKDAMNFARSTFKLA